MDAEVRTVWINTLDTTDIDIDKNLDWDIAKGI